MRLNVWRKNSFVGEEVLLKGRVLNWSDFPQASRFFLNDNIYFVINGI